MEIKTGLTTDKECLAGYASWEDAIKDYEYQKRTKPVPPAEKQELIIRKGNESLISATTEADEESLKIEFNLGKGRRLAPPNTEQNARMFGVIGMGTQPIFASDETTESLETEEKLESTHPDVWIGNTLINPNKGRKPTGENLAQGQKSFVIEQSGAVREDAWLGNHKVDPSKGRGHVPDPAMMKGRPDLFDHMHQKPINPNIHEERDNWIGNPIHKTGKGRKPLRSPAENVCEFTAVMQHSDLHRRTTSDESSQNNKDLPKAAQSVVKEVINGTYEGEEVAGGKLNVISHHPELASAVMKMDPDVVQGSDRKIRKHYKEHQGTKVSMLAWQEQSKHLDICLN